MAKNLIKVAVYIKSYVPTPQEKEFIDSLGVAQVLNSQFFQPKSGQRVDANKVYNLTDNKEIDEFYADVLVDASVPQDPIVFKPEAKDVSETEGVSEDEGAAPKEEKPAPKTRTRRAKSEG